MNAGPHFLKTRSKGIVSAKTAAKPNGNWGTLLGQPLTVKPAPENGPWVESKAPAASRTA